MLSAENNKFPNSAGLFLLCKEILQLKHFLQNEITDQSVGALLDFNPTDCTQWKYGRKNIKDLQKLHKLADKLEIDFRSLADIIQGRSPILDTLHDFKDYGSFTSDILTRKKLYCAAEALLRRADVKCLPVFIPELLPVISGLNVFQQTFEGNALIEEKVEGGMHTITWSKRIKLCGSLRFALMQRIAKYYLDRNKDKLQLNFKLNPEEYNLFALFLLMPPYLFQIACSQRDPAKDIVDEFSRLFWITRTIVNIRLKDFFLYQN